MVKAKLTRLFYIAGLDSPSNSVEFTPDELHRFFKKFIIESGWKVMIPNLSDPNGNISSAVKLEEVVKY